MKKSVLVLMLLCCCLKLQAQQAKQKRMLLLQIAALRTYVNYAAKGYQAVKSGLHFISDAKKGELDLHSDYFTALAAVNPKVKKYARVAEMVKLQIRTVKICKKTFEKVRQEDLFYGHELDYIERSFERLLESGSANLDNLFLLISSTELELTDDQRIERLDRLYENVLEDYVFCEKFSSELALLRQSKARETKEARQSGILAGLQTDRP